MAWQTKLQGIPRDHGQPIWSMGNIHWWDVDVLQGDARFRVRNRSGHRDYVAVLTPTEARTMAQSFRTRASLEYAKRVRRLDALLAQEAPTSCWILVSVEEWSSGLG